MNMSTYINASIKQLIYKNGVPFEMVNPMPSDELLAALAESDEIIKEHKEGKREGYKNFDDMTRAILNGEAK